MFIILMKGRRGCEFFASPLTDRPPSDLIAEMVKECRALRGALWWNPVFRLAGFLGIDWRFPGLYRLLLGVRYEYHKGAPSSWLSCSSSLPWAPREEVWKEEVVEEMDII
ncbi:hypothetical protein N658DRAFT_507456 [Parathielavia hyrcaniae]|uniref:Uncharacterized protein n=1 Tax=Parathielavia hyrcaniae TaxID=113614 RepID=A0AAN6Q0Z7_9PEZI|nr:hypothetical protein N658DRAFT_507456 [Parathielavia hyrcaniae]